jgi:hypothetical protein
VPDIDSKQLINKVHGERGSQNSSGSQPTLEAKEPKRVGKAA